MFPDSNSSFDSMSAFLNNNPEMSKTGTANKENVSTQRMRPVTAQDIEDPLSYFCKERKRLSPRNGNNNVDQEDWCQSQSHYVQGMSL